MSERDALALRDYLEHIEQAVGRVERYLAGTDLATFLADEQKQDAVIRNLEIIGEAAGRILREFPEFAASNPALPLKAAYGTRNALAHGYFKVDLPIVWKAAERDLPALGAAIRAALRDLPTRGSPSSL
jgi:uncharacterized protein with HEPN domain